MGTRSRLALAAFVAVVALTLAVGSAAAGRLRLSATSFTMRWSEFNVPTDIPWEERMENVRHCPLTLSGSFHASTIVKAVESLVGYVTTAQMGTCTGTGGAVTLLRTGLPWHLRYRSFSGFLPAITKVRLALSGFGLSIFVPSLMTTCLVRTSVTEPLNLDFERERGGTISAVRVDETSSIDATDTTGFLCDASRPPLRWNFAGSAALEQGTGRSVTVTLI